MLDCIVTAPVDVTFEVVSRQGTDEVVLTTWSKHFDPLAASYDAQPYEVARDISAIDGGQLVFRYSAANTTKSEAWIPNGDGTKSHGRIPNITLPQ